MNHSKQCAVVEKPVEEGLGAQVVLPNACVLNLCRAPFLDGPRVAWG